MPKFNFFALEMLEARQLYTTVAEVGVTVLNRTLTIVGAQAADDFSIEAARGTFTTHLNGVSSTYSTSAIRFIRIFGGDGNDNIILSPRLAVRASIEGGNGNDRIGGGALNDTILGQRGNDTITGNGGEDYLDGGAGNDRFDDRLDVNVFHGGSGTDRVVSGNAYFGSGVEYGVPSASMTAATTGGVTDLSTVDGRIILTYKGSLPSLGASLDQGGPTLRSDGEYEITNTFHEGFDAIVGSFSNQWDLSAAAPHGVIFKYIDGGDGSTVYSFPFLLPTK